MLSSQIVLLDKIKQARINNYRVLQRLLFDLGLKDRFKLEENIIPGVFVFNKGATDIDLPLLKQFLYAQGIECSVFYGEQAFYLPVHQNLSETDLLYFYEAIKYFINTTT